MLVGARSLLHNLAAPARSLCSVAEASQAEVLEFLRAASRPVMGHAKAKQSAGQKALDLTKQASRLEDLDMRALALVDTHELRRRGVPCQERKLLLRFCSKIRQGWRHKGNQGTSAHGLVRAWKRGWVAPYQQGHPRRWPWNEPYWRTPQSG